MDKKTLTIIGTLGVIIFGVIASIVAWFAGGKELEGNAKEVIRQMFNFEITLIIAGVAIGVVGAFIQFVVLLAPLLTIANIVVAIMAFLAANKDNEFKIPAIEFIK